MKARPHFAPSVALATLLFAGVAQKASAQSASATCPTAAETTETIKDLAAQARSASNEIATDLAVKVDEPVRVAGNVNAATDEFWSVTGRPPFPVGMERIPTTPEVIASRTTALADQGATRVEAADSATPGIVRVAKALKLLAKIIHREVSPDSEQPALAGCTTPAEDLATRARAATLQIAAGFRNTPADPTAAAGSVNAALDQVWSGTGRPSFPVGMPMTPTTEDVIKLRTRMLADKIEIGIEFSALPGAPNAPSAAVEQKVSKLEFLAGSVARNYPTASALGK